MTKFIITHNQTDACVFISYASNAEAALDDFAGFRSGYDTFTEMARSATFREIADVSTIKAEG